MRENTEIRTAPGPADEAIMDEPPVRIAEGKMGALLGAVASIITFMVSMVSDKNIFETSHSLVTSFLIFGLLGWLAASTMNWHFSSAYKRQREAERKMRLHAELEAEREAAEEEKRLAAEADLAQKSSIDEERTDPA
ncbi:MAG: hypothetical protein JW941_11495 [Candidatus Coatesbacteria bacterium]|nr:hypothetical protein [Candidatus Coatesbacteria bacterium]